VHTASNATTAAPGFRIVIFGLPLEIGAGGSDGATIGCESEAFNARQRNRR
jgi:hypothetical protein